MILVLVEQRVLSVAIDLKLLIYIYGKLDGSQKNILYNFKIFGIVFNVFRIYYGKLW